MKHLLLRPWSLTPPALPFTFPTLSIKQRRLCLSAATATEMTPAAATHQEGELSGRERRKLRNERRESKLGSSWREEVEERLMKKPKKKNVPKSAELNLDNLALLGPRWWILRVSRQRGHETADVVARLLARNFPHLEFKVYAPAVQVKRKLKNGTISIKPKPIFPGCVFLWCVMNKELHDFIRECEGVGGFVGAKVLYAKRQINKPVPVDAEDMKEIFQQAKEEQEKEDQAFEEQQLVEAPPDKKKLETDDATNSATKSKLRMALSEASDPLPNGSPRKRGKVALTPGTAIQVLSGKLAGFKGTLKKLNRKSQKATVGFTIFGKESMVDLDLEEIVAET